MNSRQRRLAVVALLGIGLLVGDRLVLSPLVQGWKTRVEAIAQLKRAVNDGSLLIQRETAIRTRWNEMRTNTLDSQISVAESQVLKAFDRWSRDSGVSISSLRPQWKRGGEGFATLECRADAGGDLSTLTRFLYAAESDPLALRVELVELTARDTEGQQLTLVLQVSGLVLQPSGS